MTTLKDKEINLENLIIINSKYKQVYFKQDVKEAVLELKKRVDNAGGLAWFDIIEIFGDFK